MCDICVMNSVKDKMLSRRNFFKTTAATATGAAAIVGAGLSTTAMAKGHMEGVEDLTHELHEDFPTYFGTSLFSREEVYNYAEHSFNLFNITMSEHVGTHIDAPLHFSADGTAVAELEVANLVAPLCVIDIKAKAAESADAQVTPDDIKAWMSTYGDIPEHACVAMNSGWSAKVDTARFRNADGEGTQHYPGFHVEAATMLMEETGAQSIAVDTLSLDYGMSGDFATHYAWLPSGRFGIECVANLDAVPEAGAKIVVGAPKIRGGTGGTARIFAMV